MKKVLAPILGSLVLTFSAMATPPGLHPKFPVVVGTYRLTEDWSITLPQPHNRRIEEGAMMLWRPTFTVRLVVWNNPKDKTPAQLYSSWRSRIAPEATEIVELPNDIPPRFSYRLQEPRDIGVVYELDGFVIGPTSHVYAVIYFDRPEQIVEAREVFDSLSSLEAQPTVQGPTSPPSAGPRP